MTDTINITLSWTDAVDAIMVPHLKQHGLSYVDWFRIAADAWFLEYKRQVEADDIKMIHKSPPSGVKHTALISKDLHGRLSEIAEIERTSLGDILWEITIHYVEKERVWTSHYDRTPRLMAVRMFIEDAELVEHYIKSDRFEDATAFWEEALHDWLEERSSHGDQPYFGYPASPNKTALLNGEAKAVTAAPLTSTSARVEKWTEEDQTTLSSAYYRAAINLLDKLEREEANAADPA